VEVRLVYFDGCPNWQLARKRLRQVLDWLGRADVPIKGVRVGTLDEAMAAGFAGSPTILIDGRDLCPHSTVCTGGVACRLYRTPAGSAGAPPVEDIMGALSERV
jgi:hypothetical protein